MKQAAIWLQKSNNNIKRKINTYNEEIEKDTLLKNKFLNNSCDFKTLEGLSKMSLALESKYIDLDSDKLLLESNWKYINTLNELNDLIKVMNKILSPPPKKESESEEDDNEHDEKERLRLMEFIELRKKELQYILKGFDLICSISKVNPLVTMDYLKKIITQTEMRYKQFIYVLRDGNYVWENGVDNYEFFKSKKDVRLISSINGSTKFKFLGVLDAIHVKYLFSDSSGNLLNIATSKEYYEISHKSKNMSLFIRIKESAELGENEKVSEIKSNLSRDVAVQSLGYVFNLLEGKKLSTNSINKVLQILNSHQKIEKANIKIN